MDVIKKINDNYILIIILIVAALIRLFPIAWDGGYYTHPDERHIYSVVSQLDFPDSIAEFFSEESTWDPHFYAYGSLPLYLLHFASQAYSSIDFYANTYQKLYTVARPLSAYFDLGTVSLVYLFIKLFTKDKRHSLLGAALYAILVFPIQNAHFYTVDTQLTFWCVLTLFLLTKGVKQLNTSYFYVASVSIAAAVSTKIIGLALFASFGIALLIYVLRLPEIKALHKVISFIKIGILSTSIILFLTMFFQPYVFLNWETFMNDISVQTRMRTDATVFPYTIQYLTTTNYLYPIKQIINWGMGIVPAVIGMVGFVFISFQKGLLLIKDKQFSSWLPLIVFAWIIFLFMGAS
ncbi:phospholipid carrier-dependent glycosyltransferase, partial [candidate division WWE3 bacterium]|nr:phospholipid carrier-dependent glycosyltransferase [candidate division WWE3 bacterium]